MNRRKMDINGIRVNRPCSSDWEGMVGDERMRFCAECDKQVYNLASMTWREIEALVRNTSGRFCARVIRDTNGSVMTASPGAGFNLVNLRASKIATAVMTATLSMSQSGMAQTSNRINPSQSVYQKSVIKQELTNNQGLQQTAILTGKVSDQIGASIADALITLRSEGKTLLFNANTNEEGIFEISGLPEGSFELKIESRGFVTLKLTVNLQTGRILNVDSILAVGLVGGCEVNCGRDEFIEPTSIPSLLLNPLKAVRLLLKKN